MSGMIAAARRHHRRRFQQVRAPRRFAKVVPLDEIHVLVTDARPPDDLAQALEAARVDLVVAGERPAFYQAGPARSRELADRVPVSRGRGGVESLRSITPGVGFAPVTPAVVDTKGPCADQPDPFGPGMPVEPCQERRGEPVPPGSRRTNRSVGSRPPRETGSPPGPRRAAAGARITTLVSPNRRAGPSRRPPARHSAATRSR